MKWNYDRVAAKLDNAFMEREAIEQISLSRTINIPESYAIQSILVGKRLIRGNSFTGIKMGFTSKAKMEQMGVHDMIWGKLTSDMEIKNGFSTLRDRYIHPRAEPEIAFLLGKDINELVDVKSVKDYVEYIAPAIEVIDSRYKNFKFSLEDVIADNCSSAGYCIGNWLNPSSQIENIKIDLSVDGKVVHSGNSNAILGNPWQSLVDAVRLADEYGVKLRKGYIILAGAATAAVYIERGQEISMQAEGLGETKFKVE